MFIGNTLVTPKNNVLLGITREAVLDIANKKFKIEQRDVSLSEFLKSDEVFITSSYKDIVPIVKINRKVIGDRKVGKNTRKLINLFSEFILN